MSRSQPAPDTTRAAKLAARERRCEARRAESQAHAVEERRLRRRSRLCGGLRLLLFAIVCIAAVQAGRGIERRLSVAITIAAAVLFVAVVAYHQTVLAAETRARRRRILAEESAARQAGGAGPGAGGELPAAPVSDLDAGLAVHQPEPASHRLDAWALEDLGIEGERSSLRAMLDTTSSQLGARRLLRMLRHPLLDAAAIGDRQTTVRELAATPALRDGLQLAAFGCRGRSQARVPGFLASPRLLPGGVLRIAAALVAFTCVPSIVLAATDRGEFLPAAAATATVAVTMNFLLARRSRLLRDAYLELEPIVLQALDVAPLFAARTPQSPRLQSVAALLAEFTRPGASQRLSHAARAMRCLHLHETGMFYGLVQMLTLWDVHWLAALESAVKRTPGQWERLIGALADLEAHAALGVFAAEQAAVVFPEILADGAPRLVIEAGEHPLLDASRAVPNDVELGGDGRLAIVTGSNMAGKSTFLRMVALDVHLAQMGLPVRACSMRLTPVALYANINVRDSLADGKSYFFVEVERVRAILAAATERQHVLGIFDELFRGTNSRERLAASREIARSLAASGGLFLLATHDQELAAMAERESVPGIVAVHFRDEIDAGRMVFPYRLHPGVAQTHNALRLLEIAGYPEDLVRRAREHAEGGAPAESE